MARSRKRQAPNLDAVVGAQIRTLRRRRDLSQQELADLIQKLGRKTSQPVVGRMEGVGGQRSITIADLFAVAAALDVAPVELLAASFEPQLVPIVGDLRAEPRDAADWIRGYRPLGDGNEPLYFESVSEERKQANLRVRGLQNLRWILSDYEEAALRDDIYGMVESLRVLRDELERQEHNLEQQPKRYERAIAKQQRELAAMQKREAAKKKRLASARAKRR